MVEILQPDPEAKCPGSRTETGSTERHSCSRSGEEQHAKARTHLSTVAPRSGEITAVAHRPLLDWRRWLHHHPAAKSVLIGLACALAWPTATQLVRMLPGFTGFYGIPFALAAVIIAAWYGGLIAGLTTTFMSSALLYVILPEMRMLDVQRETIWHLIVFTIIAFLLSDFEAIERNKQERLRWEKASRDEFLGIMSHELRTPMTMVYSGIRILHRRWQGILEPEREELLHSIEEESEHLVNMTEDLLSLARIDDGQVAREPMLVLRIVERTVSSYQAGRPERQVDLSLPEESWVAMGQERYLTAVLRNLMTNADKYSAAGPPISVSATRENGRGTIRVRDRGRGVSEGQLEAIFEPYYRDPSLPPGPRGLGMGLSLCKRAVEAMGGSIWASRIEGGGLEVAFALPLVEDAIKAQSPVKP